MSQSERSPGLSPIGQWPLAADPALADGRVPLRLTATRGALGIELYEPVEVGPLELRGLSATLPGLRFPVDLSGGVPVFRHRRGDLERLELAVTHTGLSSWLAPRFGDIVGPLERAPSVWTLPQGLALGLSGARGALAFDLLWAPIGGDARFVLSHVRGAGLSAPALLFALQAVDTLFGELGERTGRLVTVRGVAARLTRAVLPAVGARAPSTARVRFGELESHGDEVHVALDSAFEPALMHAAAARALELATLTLQADDALVRGELDAARALYIAALEHAPRHPQITQLIGEIDLFSAGRAEAALGLIVESLPAARSGFIGAELLARTGDLAGASEAIENMVQGEPFAPLSARLWLRLSELTSSGAEQRGFLDRAVAASPGLAEVRWARFDARVELGDVDGALADAEHLEAGSLGASARHGACTRSARALLTHGFIKDAGRLFERALRYVPDDAVATAGLARSLMEAGKSQRAFALLARAVALSERTGRGDADALVDMARLLATDLEDMPQAIARVRQVQAGSPRAIEAALLEGQWRATIGDVAGASLAFGRMRDRIELAKAPPDAAAEWLMQAARFERDTQGDVLSAERHLAVALRVSPRDKDVASAYREVAAVVAARGRRERGRVEPEPQRKAARRPPAAASADAGLEVELPAATAEPLEVELPQREAARVELRLAEAEPLEVELPPGREVELELALGADEPPGRLVGIDTEAEREPRSDEPSDTFVPPEDPEIPAEFDPRDVELASRLELAVRANAEDDALALELADVLTRLGRDHEVYALLSARRDEIAEHRRADLMWRLRQVLSRLASRAVRDGRLSEATLYRAALAALDEDEV